LPQGESGLFYGREALTLSGPDWPTAVTRQFSSKAYHLSNHHYLVMTEEFANVGWHPDGVALPLLFDGRLQATAVQDPS